MSIESANEFITYMAISYFVIAIPLHILSIFMTTTAKKNIQKYVIFRSKGIPYINFFLFFCIIEGIIGIIQISFMLTRSDGYPVRFFTSLQNTITWGVAFLLLGRQLILSKIFKTIPQLRIIKEGERYFVILPPILGSVLWAIIIEGPIWAYNHILKTGNAYNRPASYVFTVVFLIFYLIAVICNTKIPNKLYTDYYTNIISIINCVVVASIWGSVVEILSPRMERTIVAPGIGSLCLCLLVHVSHILLLLRPCLAIWRKETEYLDNWEKFAREYHPSSSTTTDDPPSSLTTVPVLSIS